MLERGDWLELLCHQNVFKDAKSLLSQLNELFHISWPLVDPLCLSIKGDLDPLLSIVRLATTSEIFIRLHPNLVKVGLKAPTVECPLLSGKISLALLLVLIRAAHEAFIRCI